MSSEPQSSPPPSKLTASAMPFVPQPAKLGAEAAYDAEWDYSPYGGMQEDLRIAVAGIPVTVGTGMGFRGAPLVKNAKKESEKEEGLSVNAKPWAPPEDALLDEPSWQTIKQNGADLVIPAPMTVKDPKDKMFSHSFTIYPRQKRFAHLDFYYYSCLKCPLRTLYGRLSSRKADLALVNVSPDVPPLCIAHLIEQITKVKVSAIHYCDTVPLQVHIWLEKLNMYEQVAKLLTESLWSCPVTHQFAIFAVNEEAKSFLKSYLEDLKKMPEAAQSSCCLDLVEIKEIKQN